MKIKKCSDKIKRAFLALQKISREKENAFQGPVIAIMPLVQPREKDDINCENCRSNDLYLGQSFSKNDVFYHLLSMFVIVI